MVSTIKLKELDFDMIEDYYQYIYSSVVNGQRDQARSLIKNLSRRQKKEAIQFIDDTLSGDIAKEVKQMIIESIL